MKEELRIDRTRLDFECLRQPQLVGNTNTLLANKQWERDSCKEQLELLKATVDSEIRADKESFGITTGLTENVVKSVVLQDTRVIEKTNEYLILCKEYNILTGDKLALDNKRTCLEMLVKLFIAGYWAEPHIKEVDSKEYIESASTGTNMGKLEENSRLIERRKRYVESK